MVARYRLVHFVPDPFTGARIPVAALVAGGGGVSVASATHLPAAACLGRAPTYAAMQMVLEALSAAESFDVLPVAVGPQAILDVERQIPGDVSDPVKWVVEHVLPRVTENRPPRETRSHHRDTEGYRFFETWNVSRYVQRRFRPDQAWSELGSTTPRMLAQVSHWVGAPNVGLLLMEPIVLTRPGLQGDLIEVHQRFASYRLFLDSGDIPEETREKTKLYVYVLAGGKAQDRHSALTSFTSVGATTIDTESESARQSFLGEIRSVGREANPEIDLLVGPTN
jgi:hypothetical protein